ncbi:unnamed protein product [Agarophyton chilense]
MKGIHRIESHVGFHKKDFGAYARRLAEDADKYEYVHRNKNDVLNDSIIPINVQSIPSNKSGKDDDDDTKRNVKPRREGPFCFNTVKCKGKRHYIRKLPNSTLEEIEAFLKAYMESKKKKRNANSIKKIGDKEHSSDEQRSSTVFDTLFCDGNLEAKVTADQGSSANTTP